MLDSDHLGELTTEPMIAGDKLEVEYSCMRKLRTGEVLGNGLSIELLKGLLRNM